MNKRDKDNFVERLVQHLLKCEIDNEQDQMIPVDRKTFHQILLYILMKEVLDTKHEMTDSHFLVQLDEMMREVQNESEQILILLKEKS